ncbi:NDR1/HIN1-like protein 6 [Beta vulgaris subsp. vulgaris]|uniref:NDR1/HIN1-like protein 6 n=1 Tax=Beta vulgaris subsp. vulgaris TaxID=3555 RepID=UPI002036CAF0|nr:NDR1/HIN1-like protein 6 [Beta vulgaris subsp. vulgaris]
MADGALKKPPGFRDSNGPPQYRPPPQTAGPRKPPVPSYYQPKQKRRSCCCRCCCCFICILFILFLLFIAFFGIFYAWYQPKLPIFKFRPVELNRFNITAKPDGTALLDSKIIIRVEVKNPNSKIKIYYDVTEVTLMADEEIELGSASLPAFKQPANNVTLLKFTAETGKKVVDSTTGLKLKDRVKNEQVVVNAAVKTKVGVGVFNTKFGMLPVNVNCGGITLKQINDGKTSPKCSFNTLRWINVK